MLLSILENWMVDDMTPKQVRYLRPISPGNAQAQIADIYAQIRRDFQLVPPLTLFSPSSELLAGIWSLWRESQFVEDKVPREILEAVSAAISTLNACSYCVDAHSGMLHAASKHEIVDAIFAQNNSLISHDKTRQIVEWALATKTPDAQILKTPPFTDKEAPTIVGTAIVYHFINKMVSIFLAPSPLPIPTRSPKLRRIGLRIFGATLAKRIMKRKSSPGESLKFITQVNLTNDINWAKNNANISATYANFTRYIEKLGRDYLPTPVKQVVNRHINTWQGEEMGLSQNWVKELIAELNDENKAIAKLALLTAFSPHQVDDKVIEEFRTVYKDDKELLYVTAWASFSVAKKIETWIYPS